MSRPVSLAIAAALLFACATGPGRNPGSVAAAYAAAGRYDDAAREIELVVRTHPRNAELRRQAATLLADQAS